MNIQRSKGSSKANPAKQSDTGGKLGRTQDASTSARTLRSKTSSSARKTSQNDENRSQQLPTGRARDSKQGTKSADRHSKSQKNPTRK